MLTEWTMKVIVSEGHGIRRSRISEGPGSPKVQDLRKSRAIGKPWSLPQERNLQILGSHDFLDRILLFVHNHLVNSNHIKGREYT